MTTFLVAYALLAASPANIDPPPVAPAAVPQAVLPQAVEKTIEKGPVVPLRTGIELRDAARAALRRWARPRDEDAQAAAREFLVLFRELQADARLARVTREPLRRQVRGRLIALSRQIRILSAHRKRREKNEVPESVANAAERNGPLAQQGGMGGPMMGGAAFGRPGPNDDYGDELVELIQTTIAPASWDVNGGHGSIYYWRGGRAIVVRQTGENHRQIADVLQQMEKMNR